MAILGGWAFSHERGTPVTVPIPYRDLSAPFQTKSIPVLLPLFSSVKPYSHTMSVCVASARAEPFQIIPETKQMVPILYRDLSAPFQMKSIASSFVLTRRMATTPEISLPLHPTPYALRPTPCTLHPTAPISESKQTVPTPYRDVKRTLPDEEHRVLLRLDRVHLPNPRNLIRTSVYDKYSGSRKITAHIDHICHCKKASGTHRLDG